MANPGYMSIKGVAQGLISAGCSTPESIGNKYQSSHTDEIMVLSYRHNLANIGTISKPTHTARLSSPKPLINPPRYSLRRSQAEKK